MRLKAFKSSTQPETKRTSFDVFNGTGSPEGVVTGSIGDYYLKQDAPGGIYVKQTGSATNTGWVTYDSVQAQLSLTIANGQASALSLSGLLYDFNTYVGVIIAFRLRRKTDSNTLLDVGELFLAYNDVAANWRIRQFNSMDSTGVEFSITSGGQVQYVSDTLAGTNYNGQLKTKVIRYIDAG